METRNDSQKSVSRWQQAGNFLHDTTARTLGISKTIVDVTFRTITQNPLVIRVAQIPFVQTVYQKCERAVAPIVLRTVPVIVGSCKHIVAQTSNRTHDLTLKFARTMLADYLSEEQVQQFSSSFTEEEQRILLRELDAPFISYYCRSKVGMSLNVQPEFARRFLQLLYKVAQRQLESQELNPAQRGMWQLIVIIYSEEKLLEQLTPAICPLLGELIILYKGYVAAQKRENGFSFKIPQPTIGQIQAAQQSAKLLSKYLPDLMPLAFIWAKERFPTLTFIETINESARASKEPITPLLWLNHFSLILVQAIQKDAEAFTVFSDSLFSYLKEQGITKLPNILYSFLVELVLYRKHPELAAQFATLLDSIEENWVEENTLGIPVLRQAALSFLEKIVLQKLPLNSLLDDPAISETRVILKQAMQEALESIPKSNILYFKMVFTHLVNFYKSTYGFDFKFRLKQIPRLWESTYKAEIKRQKEFVSEHEELTPVAITQVERIAVYTVCKFISSLIQKNLPSQKPEEEEDYTNEPSINDAIALYEKSQFQAEESIEDTAPVSEDEQNHTVAYPFDASIDFLEACLVGSEEFSPALIKNSCKFLKEFTHTPDILPDLQLLFEGLATRTLDSKYRFTDGQIKQFTNTFLQVRKKLEITSKGYTEEQYLEFVNIFCNNFPLGELVKVLRKEKTNITDPRHEQFLLFLSTILNEFSTKLSVSEI